MLLILNAIPNIVVWTERSVPALFYYPCLPFPSIAKQSFLLTIPHPREASFGGGGVVIEVFDEDFGDPVDFLGQVCLHLLQLERCAWSNAMSGNEIQLHYAARCVTLVLKLTDPRTMNGPGCHFWRGSSPLPLPWDLKRSRSSQQTSRAAKEARGAVFNRRVGAEYVP